MQTTPAFIVPAQISPLSSSLSIWYLLLCVSHVKFCMSRIACLFPLPNTTKPVPLHLPWRPCVQSRHQRPPALSFYMFKPTASFVNSVSKLLLEMTHFSPVPQPQPPKPTIISNWNSCNSPLTGVLGFICPH